LIRSFAAVRSSAHSMRSTRSAALAPVGDLFESMIKRDLRIKDSGTIFGPHGGLLDRLDAALFTIVAGYYLAIALVY